MVNNHPKYVAMTDPRQLLIQNIIVMIPSEYLKFPINFMVQKNQIYQQLQNKLQ